MTLSMGVKNSATAQFFGLLMNWALYATLATQVYTYHISFPKDKPVYKAIVYGIFLLENAQTAALTYGVYDSFITHFGDPVAIESVQLTWFAIPLCTGIVSCVAQAVYMYRIYKLSRSFAMTAVTLVFTILQLATAMAETVHAHNSQSFNKFEYTSRRILATWSFSAAACDVVIASCMTYCLLKCDPGLKKTTVLITRLIRLGIETGTVTAILAILNAVLFIALPGNEAFNAPAFILSKSYSNALLRLLNSRVSLNNRIRECENPISSVEFADSMSRFEQLARPDRRQALSWDLPQLEPAFQPRLSMARKSICIRRETVVFTDAAAKGGRDPPSPFSTVSSE